MGMLSLHIAACQVNERQRTKCSSPRPTRTLRSGIIRVSLSLLRVDIVTSPEEDVSMNALKSSVISSGIVLLYLRQQQR